MFSAARPDLRVTLLSTHDRGRTVIRDARIERSVCPLRFFVATPTTTNIPGASQSAHGTVARGRRCPSTITSYIFDGRPFPGASRLR